MVVLNRPINQALNCQIGIVNLLYVIARPFIAFMSVFLRNH